MFKFSTGRGVKLRDLHIAASSPSLGTWRRGWCFVTLSDSTLQINWVQPK